jgi:hypothetical protein
MYIFLDIQINQLFNSLCMEINLGTYFNEMELY